jgi:hypothetical protein
MHPISKRSLTSAAPWLVALALVASPGSAQELLPTTCGAEMSLSPQLAGAEGGTLQPLDTEERLFYPTTEIAGSTVELTWLLEGEPYVTETIDLATAERPSGAGLARTGARSADLLTAPREELAVEILSLRPDLVRELLGFAENGLRIDLEVRVDGALRDSLPFAELKRQSDELRGAPFVPLVVTPSLDGRGAGRRPASPIRVKTYLEDCWDCTSTTPCDTECGWDEGKGGPVTCGEYGAPCQPAGCQCQYPSSDSWTGWYDYAFYPIGPDICMHSWLGGSTWHRRWERVRRRDLVRRTTICPNCPSCSGCYVDEQIIGYQLAYFHCYLDTWNTCSFGFRPCCSVLCEVSGLTPCDFC